MAYADYALLRNSALPGGVYVAWFSTWIWCASPTLGVFLVLLFPDGRLSSRRWRIVAWAVVLGPPCRARICFHPENLTQPSRLTTRSAFWRYRRRFKTYGLFGASRLFGMTLLLMSTFAALFSLILRLRRARGNERQQIKWFMFAAVPLNVFLSLVELHT